VSPLSDPHPFPLRARNAAPKFTAALFAFCALCGALWSPGSAWAAGGISRYPPCEPVPVLGLRPADSLHTLRLGPQRQGTACRTEAGTAVSPHLVLAVLAVVLLLAALLALFLWERRRRRRTERELESAVATDEMSAAIAHELRQPLAAILSNAEAALMLLERRPPRVDDVRKALHDIIQDDKRATAVIRRIAALYRGSGPVAEKVDFNALVTKVADMIRGEAAERDIELALALDPALPHIHGDRVQLQQVVLNLVRNAMEAVAAGSEFRRVMLTTQTGEGRSIRIAVSDSGIGIPEHARAHIFEPFYTTKRQGTGMGLAVSRRIVEAHGGRLYASRSCLGGAQLALELPITKEEP